VVRRAGWDASFSALKCVSLTALVGGAIAYDVAEPPKGSTLPLRCVCSRNSAQSCARLQIEREAADGADSIARRVGKLQFDGSWV
jgi:hypothetical protein